MRVIVDDASVAFGDRIVFEQLTAVFEPGRVTALVGPSGSGKSTLLAAVAGYQRLRVGIVRWVDDAGEPGPPDPSGVVWVPQGSNALGARSALDNVMVAPLSEGRSVEESETIARGALAKVGLLERAEDLARTLSGGELQRVGFARALASSRPVVLADEPSAGLDAGNTRRLAELLAALEARATIVLATHDPLLRDAAGAVVDIRAKATRAS